MTLFRRVFFAAVLAGLAAGLLMAALQQWRVVPLIVAAESFEDGSDHDHAEGTPAHTHETTGATETQAEAAWAPQDGAERIFYTVLADVLAAIGFAFLLAATALVFNLPLTAGNGVLWGLGGFLAFHLAPSFGLPPELPGMPAADLSARQLWWWSTALCTAAGLLALAKWRTAPALAAALALIAMPHLIGAPRPLDPSSAVPAHLATEFAASTLAVSAVFWLALGSALGWLQQRLAEREATTLRRATA